MPLTGQLTPSRGLVKIYAPQPGHILYRSAIEGAAVDRDAMMFTLATDRHTSSGDIAAVVGEQVADRVEKLREEEERVRLINKRDSEASRERIVSLQTEVKEVQTQLSVARDRTSVSEEVERSYAGLLKQGFVSNEQYQQKRAELLDQRAHFDALERELTTVLRELAVRKSEQVSLALKGSNDLSQLARSVAASKQDLAENEAKGGLILRAPIAGTVTAVTANIGQSIDLQKPLAAIVPAGDSLVAELYAPSASIGFIRSGQRVLIRLPAFPYQKFGHLRGVVKTVALTSLPSNELPGAAVSDPKDGHQPEPVYRITIAIDSQSIKAYGENVPLQAGMTVQADVFQETRKLYEWALEPLYSISGKI